MTDRATRVKLQIYSEIARTTRVPTLKELASALDLPIPAVEGALDALQSQRLVVLDRSSGEILMAPPFSAVPTQHQVTVEGRDYYANCIWDAFGIAAALGKDSRTVSACGDCGEPLTFRVHDGLPQPAEAVMHYAVPAAHWWDDIVFT